jgi:hypothetical protein
MDRRSLLVILNRYCDAICLRDTKNLPLSPEVRVTSNGDEVAVAEGIVWKMQGTLRIPYRRAIVDAKRGAGMMRLTVTNQVVGRRSTPEQIMNPPPGEWLWFALRIKVANGVITEIEEIASSTGFPGTPASATTNDRIWDAIVPEEQRSSEKELQRIADDYFSTVSGDIPWYDAPFHPECNRYENGAPTTNAVFIPGGVGLGLLSPTLQGLKVTDRRYSILKSVNAGIS